MYSNYRHRRLHNNIGYQIKPLRGDPIYQVSDDISSKLYYNQYGEPYIKRTDHDGTKQLGAGIGQKQTNIYREAFNKIVGIQETTGSGFFEGFKRGLTGKPLHDKKFKRLSPEQKKRMAEQYVKRKSQSAEGIFQDIYKTFEPKHLLKRAKPGLNLNLVNKLRKHRKPKKRKSKKSTKEVKGRGVDIIENISAKIKKDLQNRKDLLSAEIKQERKKDPLLRLKRKAKKRTLENMIQSKVKNMIKTK
jgi:hypothetical protein